MDRMKKIVLWLLCVAVAMPLLAQTELAPKKSYLVADFNEKELDNMLEICQKGGFEYLLVRTPFSTFGHYQWNPEFAADDQTVARMVQKAETVGIHLGLLVRPDAISENDAYFKPQYFKQFKREGEVKLYSDITADQRDFTLRRNDVIKGVASLNLLLVDDELISYGAMEPVGELMLLYYCTRGAYGTAKAAHSTTAKAFKIWDSPLRFVAPDGELLDSVSMQLNRGIEASGVAFVLKVGESGQELLDASVRVRQVERWDGDQDVEKNGLGWIAIHAADPKRNATSFDDVEWMMTKAAGFDAGYGLIIDKKALKVHGQLDEILEMIRQWDQLRSANSFSADQREDLRDPYLDWHLDKVDDHHFTLSQWNFSRRYKCKFVKEESLLLTGEPWEWKAEAQGRFGLRLFVEGEVPVVNPMVNTEVGLVMFPCTIQPGQSLMYGFDDVAYVMDANCKKIAEVAIEGISVLPKGTSEVTFLCETENEGDRPEVTLRYITIEKTEQIVK